MSHDFTQSGQKIKQPCWMCHRCMDLRGPGCMEVLQCCSSSYDRQYKIVGGWQIFLGGELWGRKNQTLWPWGENSVVMERNSRLNRPTNTNRCCMMSPQLPLWVCCSIIWFCFFYFSNLPMCFWLFLIMYWICYFVLCQKSVFEESTWK